MRRTATRATTGFARRANGILWTALPAIIAGSAVAIGAPESLMRGDATLAATRPGMGLPTSWTASLSGRSDLWYAAFAALWAAVALGLFIVLMTAVRRTQRRRELRLGAARYVATLHGVSAVSRSSPPRDPGWTAIGTNPNEQAYWDGKTWTAHRRWTGAEWVEDRSRGSRTGRGSAPIR